MPIKMTVNTSLLSAGQIAGLLPPALADRFLELTDGEELSGTDAVRAVHAATRPCQKPGVRLFAMRLIQPSASVVWICSAMGC